MKIRLVKLYSENDRFRELDFKPGINLICGQKSLDQDGNTTSKKQNGVGKTLSVELINFCLFKNTDSKILRIANRFLSRKEFVYLHLKADSQDVIVGRNKAGEIRIKTGVNGEFKEYKYTEGKRYLENLLEFSSKPITLRDYFTFFIKESGYTYEDFAEIYHESYTDLLRIHFYLFDLPIKVLTAVKGAYSSHQFAKKKITEVKKELKKEGVEVEKLQARKNALESQVESLEDNFEYSRILDSLQDRSEEINVLERELEELILEKKSLEYELAELADFASQFEDDIYIDDKDLAIVFNKYKAGLGELITNDFESVKKFRDQLSKYKNELMDEKMKSASKQLDIIDSKISARKEKINKFYADINQVNKNHIVKSFRVYRDEVNEFQKYQSLLTQYEEGDYEANSAEASFAIAVGELSQAIERGKEFKQSFQKTFLKIHNYVTSSVEASFDFSANAKFSPNKKTNFFRFNVTSETTGSTGANQITAAIYDAALHENETTKQKTYGLFIHDNLIFGLIEKDSSIQYLNYIHQNFSDDDLQYIATINMDEFNYDELKQDFVYNVTDDVIIELTRQNPLFFEMSGDLLGDKISSPDEASNEVDQDANVQKETKRKSKNTKRLTATY